MAKTKQTARKTNTPGMSMHQNDSTSSSSSGEEMDTNTEESRPVGDKSRYNWPIFTREEGRVTQASEGGQVKRKVILEYSSDEMTESQLDQISLEYPTAADVGQDQEGEEKCEAAWSHESRATVHYTPIGVEPHGPTRDVWPIATVTNDSQLHLVASSI